MAMKLSVQVRQELVQAIGERYRAGSREEKLRILDEFVAVTGYYRKHSIRLLNTPAVTASGRRPRLRLYDEAVREALVVLWEASDRVCGKRLKPLLPVIEALERHGHLRVEDVVRAKLNAASASTLDRLLAEPRGAIGRKRPARVAPAIRRHITVRTFADWKEPVPGFMEADLVAHAGETAEGSFAHTLVLTDIASGWTECVALAVREGSLPAEPRDRVARGRGAPNPSIAAEAAPPLAHTEDPFEAFWPRLLGWLHEEPDRTAVDLLRRLQSEHSGEFPDGQLRTLQRRIKPWRRAAARRLVFAGNDARLADARPSV